MYCSKCGKEMPDDAVICTGCGCLLKKEAEKPTSENVYFNSPRIARNEYYENRSKSIAKICFLISLILIGIAIYVFAVGISSIFISTYAEIKTNSYTSQAYISCSSRVYFEDSRFLVSWIFSMLALGSTITEFVFSRKQTSEAMKMVSSLMLSIAILSFLISLRFCAVYFF